MNLNVVKKDGSIATVPLLTTQPYCATLQIRYNGNIYYAPTVESYDPIGIPVCIYKVTNGSTRTHKIASQSYDPIVHDSRNGVNWSMYDSNKTISQTTRGRINVKSINNASGFLCLSYSKTIYPDYPPFKFVSTASKSVFRAEMNFFKNGSLECGLFYFYSTPSKYLDLFIDSDGHICLALNSTTATILKSSNTYHGAYTTVILEYQSSKKFVLQILKTSGTILETLTSVAKTISADTYSIYLASSQKTGAKFNGEIYYFKCSGGEYLFQTAELTFGA